MKTFKQIIAESDNSGTNEFGDPYRWIVATKDYDFVDVFAAKDKAKAEQLAKKLGKGHIVVGEKEWAGEDVEY